MSSVRTLKLALNDINSESSIEKLKQSLLHSHLKELDLSFNPIGNAGIKVLATALSSASTLESLNLMACDFNHIGAQPLMQVLQRNQRLRTLNLDRNVFDGRRLKILREFAANNGGLTCVSMNYCHLGEEGAFFFSQGLIKNKRLRTLNLAGNNFGDIGLGYFADYLGYGSFVVEHMDFSNNDITDDGAAGFARNLGQNRHMLTLNFQRNQIGKDGGMALREAVGQHPNLTRLFLEANAVQVRDIEEIDKILKKNRDEHAKMRMPRFEQELLTL